ncbi:hypothetical protein [Neptuniibacter sp.]|uniref:hypothetical protein n=1 Tax=Neptuniibacter sp. TaxID=1962643 RepID=UPI00261CA710|nr:hypothetical protein [Neptuniibacter sp.]MCP4598452.1 hypothetical protein [Neptuniibacter sp.]
MKFTGLKALLAALSVICAVLLPVQNVVAAEADPAAKVCADGKPCPAEDKAADKKPADEEPTDEELEDSCEDDGVF